VVINVASRSMINRSPVGPAPAVHARSRAWARAAAIPRSSTDDIASKQKKFEIKCGYVDNTRLDLGGVEQLAKLPGPDEIRAQLLRVMMAPATQLVRVFNAVPQQVAVLLDAYAKKLGEGGEG